MTTLTLRQARGRYLVLLGLRWFPVGLLIPVGTLLMLERGLSLPQVGLVTAAQGLVILVLELPTGGLADAIGRKPVLIAASLLSLGSLTLLTFADSVGLFLLVFVLQGIFRALDSGPLDSWYVDAVLAVDPDADLERGLGGGGAVLGVAVGAGALLSGGLVALGPIAGVSALTVPVLVAFVFQVIALVALVVLLPEVRQARGVAALRDSLRGVPTAIGGAFGLLRRSRILLALVAVELFWGFGMVTFETLLPVRLSEVIGNPDDAAALLGPASAGGLAGLGRRCGSRPGDRPPDRGCPHRRPAADRAGRDRGRDGTPGRAGRRDRRVPRLLPGARRVEPAAPGAAAPAGRRPVPDQRDLAQLDGLATGRRARRGGPDRRGRGHVGHHGHARRRGGPGRRRTALPAGLAGHPQRTRRRPGRVGAGRAGAG